MESKKRYRTRRYCSGSRRNYKKKIFEEIETIFATNEGTIHTSVEELEFDDIIVVTSAISTTYNLQHTCTA